MALTTTKVSPSTAPGLAPGTQRVAGMQRTGIGERVENISQSAWIGEGDDWSPRFEDEYEPRRDRRTTRRSREDAFLPMLARFAAGWVANETVEPHATLRASISDLRRAISVYEGSMRAISGAIRNTGEFNRLF